MNAVKELYDACSKSQETEESLMQFDKELIDCIECNIPDSDKVILMDTFNLVTKNKEEYYFKAGFQTAIDLIIK